jgi:riboflavin synthase
MFTGIVEAVGIIHSIQPEKANVHFELSCPFVSELKVDQSLSHNGVCLTVTRIEHDHYWVTAISETLQKTNLGEWKPGDTVNLERCMPANGRFDGHIVQGHVDVKGTCVNVVEDQGSWRYYFEYPAADGFVTVQKGSVCVNGVSLTVVDSGENTFSVAIIPYTWENTTFRQLKAGDGVNLEFDILGKYMQKLLQKTS